MYKGKLSVQQKLLCENVESMIPKLKRKFYDSKLAGEDVFGMLGKSQLKQFNVKLQGPTGGGKTTILEAYCESTKQPHFVSNMKGSTTSEELIGAFVPNESDKGGPYVWKDGIIIRALKYSNLWLPVTVDTSNGGFMYDLPKENYMIDFIDSVTVVDEDIISKDGDKLVVKAWPTCMLTIEEINFSPEELMSVWFSLLDVRRNMVLNEKDGEVIPCGKFMSINATMNPDYVGTNQLNEALNDRFLIKLNVTYDKKVENKIIGEKAKLYDMDISEIKFIKLFVKYIRKGYRESGCNSNISTRMIEAYLDIKGNFGYGVSKESLINSFNEDDATFVEEMFQLAFSEAETVNLTDEELEGIDMSTFKGYKKKIAKVEKTAIKTIPAPFNVGN